MALTRLTDELKTGMKLDEDIYNRDNVLLLARGAVLTEENIKTIRWLGYTRVNIQKPVDTPEYWNRIDVKKLMEFQKCYEESGKEVVELIDCIGSGQRVNVDQAFQVTGAILQEFGPPYNLFPFMSQVRELDHHTSGHSINVSLICGAICKWLALEAETSREVVVAGLLHDVGKSRLNPDILYKSQLSLKELEDFKEHTRHGYRILGEIGAPEAVRLGALLHHERVDRTGYPKGLSGDEIPLVAKIVAVADVYDTTTYNQLKNDQKVCPFKVLKTLHSDFLGALDTKILITFLARTAECYIGEMVRLSDGRTGQVVAVNRASPSRPMVRSDNDIIDLAETPKLEIEAILPVEGL